MVWLGVATGARSETGTQAQEALTLEKEWLNVSRPLTVADLKDRIILVDFWTFCCINCMHVIPDLHYLEKKFGDKLLVVGVHSAKFVNEKDSENIRSAILRYDIEHPVVNDKDFVIWKKYGANSWPTFALVAPDGRIAASFAGEGHRDELEDAITKLIAVNKDKLNTAPLPLELEKNKAPKSVLSFPGKLAYAPETQTLFIADSGHDRIVVAGLDGVIKTIIGSGKKGHKDGAFETAEFDSPQGMAYRGGLLYVADTNNHVLREIDMNKQSVRTIAGTGRQGYESRASDAPALTTPLASPWDVKLAPGGKQLVIAMAGTHQLWLYDIDTARVSVFAGNGRESIDDGAYPDNSLSQPSGLSVLGGKIYFVDSETSSLRVYEGGKIATLIGSGLFDFGFKDGAKGEAKLQHPLGLYAEEKGVTIADSYNHSLRFYDFATGKISTLKGDGKRGEFNEPNDVLKMGEAYYIADTNNNRIRVLEAGAVRTLDVGTVKATAVAFAKPESLPNVAKTPAMAVKPGEAMKIAFSLKKGWHINEEAPSYLALFAHEDEKALAVLDKDALRSGAAAFPVKLEAKQKYTVQGTLYYCEDKVGSQCLIRSISQSVSIGEKGGDALKVNLR